MTAREYRWHAARVLKARRDAKAEAERKAAEREAVLTSLRARGKQTPEREAMAKRIHSARAVARLGAFARTGGAYGGGTSQSVRRHYLAAKRRRMASPEKSAERVADWGKAYPWFVGVEVEAGSIVILVSDLRAAGKAVGSTDSFEGKPIVLRKAASKKTA